MQHHFVSVSLSLGTFGSVEARVQCPLISVDPMSDKAHSLVQTTDEVQRANEQVEVEDAANRAERKRKHATIRVPLNQIGFYPANRGGVGVSSTHIHENCADITVQK